ncbi:hypothetical protein [Albidovulum sp.]|uniref:hypothetical protein n=1 Tax=Albidovulum sp. TaxID=1872424 RepID=UPI0039B9B2A3
MSHIRLAGLSTLLLATLMHTTPLGAENVVDLRALGLSDQFLQQARRGQAMQQILPQLLRQLFTASPEGRLTAEGAAAWSEVEGAQIVAQLVTPYLGLDLDGDGLVAVAEIDRALPVLEPLPQAEAAMLRSTGDGDGDGRISPAELRAFVVARMPGVLDQRRRNIDDLLAMDLDRDGATTAEEVVRVMRAFASATAERPDLPVEPANVAPGRDCRPPLPGKTAEILLVSGYEGAALSNIAVAGPDQETTAARLVIEPGERPLYIVVSAYEAMLWQIEGATERVERIVVQPRRAAAGPGAGVTGLPEERVSFVPAGACFEPFHEAANGIKANWVRQALAGPLGRAADGVVASYTLGFTALPSGRDVTPPPAPRPVQKDALGRPVFTVDMNAPDVLMRRFHPAGLSTVDPAAVIAPEKVSAYDVLPQEAGLGQLLETGALVPAREDLGRGLGRAFIIRKPIARFPAGLAGAHSVTFILGKGVAMPAGDPGHSAVLDEETGACLSRNAVICRRFE